MAVVKTPVYNTLAVDDIPFVVGARYESAVRHQMDPRQHGGSSCNLIIKKIGKSNSSELAITSIPPPLCSNCFPACIPILFLCS